MASESSFDIVSQFDFQELRNALDQVKREISTRYDFKDSHAEVTLNEDDITVVAPDTMKLGAVKDMLFQKLVNRKLSPKILDIKEPEPAAGSMLRQVYKLIKVLDQDACKQITKIIKENFPKVKSTIQGTTVRVSSKSKDDLQAVMGKLRQEPSIKIPLEFTNYR
jgi:uncharacterized protein YajQ (UPF0234 family)